MRRWSYEDGEPGTPAPRLRLHSFLAHYAVLAKQAAEGGWGHVQYLDELAALEAAERGDRRIARLLKDAKLPREKTLATVELARFPTAVRTRRRPLTGSCTTR